MSSLRSGRTFRLPGNESRAAGLWSGSKAGRAVPRHTRTRRAGVALSALLVATLLPGQAWAIPPTDPRNGPSLVALPKDTPAVPDEEKIEELSSWAGAPVEPPAEYNPAEVTPPVGEAPVDLENAGEELVQAPGLPVRLGQASPTEDQPSPPAPSGTWDVAVENRQATENAEIDGAIITLAPPATGSTPLDVELNYSQFEDLYGTEWPSRLKLVQLPACFVDTPELEECGTPIDVPNVNDASAGTVRATVDPAAGQAEGLSTQAAGGPVVLASTDGAAGPGGSYKATSLSPSGTWTAGGSGGGFSWSYPLTVPSAPAGPAPKISFSYSSQSVDGRTSVANSQASWIGDGWDYHPGFMERRYRSCSDDRKNSANNDNSTDKKKSDLCWASDNVVMSLGGSTTELVHDDDGRWVPANDDGAKVEYKAKDGSNKTEQDDKFDGEYWVVTARDGTSYWFGRNDVDGPQGSRSVTNSVLKAPVFGNHSGEPCHEAAFANSSCEQAWRWNLDYVEDVHGNAMIIDWAKEGNRYAKNGKFKAPVNYDRGGYPTQILYGLRNNNLTGPPAGKVVFTVGQRCTKEGSTDCSNAEFESTNYEDKQPWWDTPSTLHCKATAKNCYVSAPTFWSRIKLNEVTTYGQRTPGSTSLSKVDRWNLHQSFPKQRTDTHPPLWLESITRTGFGTTQDEDGNQSSTTMPSVSFIANVVDMPNRVSKGPEDYTPDYDRLRVETIRTETGGEVFVDYSSPCAAGTAHPAPEDNTSRCYPVKWSPDPDLENPPFEWFNKYVVDKVIEKDRVARQPDVVTSYTYEGGGAWAKDTDEFSKPELRTYSQWRGYASVVVKKGNPAQTGTPDSSEQSQTRTRYFRGMSGDAGRPQITVKDSTGDLELGEDLLPYQGMAAETIAYTKAGGTVTSRELSWPYAKSTASRPRGDGLPALEAFRTGTVRTDVIQKVSSGERTGRALTTYDPTYGLPTATHTLSLTPNGTGGWTSSDKTCTTTAYVHNTAAHLIGLPQRVRTTVGDCDQAGSAGGDKVISDSRTSYDALNAFGIAPVKGLPRQVDTVSADGSGWITSQRTEYDALGRATRVTDAADQSTTTSYQPTTGPAFETTVTNPAGHASTSLTDPGRGAVLSVTDPNGRKTTSAYDDLGRVTAVWSPSRSQGSHDPSARFIYQIEADKAPTVTTRTLRDNGTYRDSIVIYDGLLRARQSQTEALGGGRIITETLYDDNGTPHEVRNGYYTHGEPDSSEIFVPKSLTEVKNAIQTSYDGLGRPTRATTLYEGDPQHSTTSQYAGDWTLTRNGMSADGSAPLSGTRAAKTWTDTLGRTSLIQHFTATDLTTNTDTSYLYDPRGNLAQVTDDDGNKWTYTHDARGRLTETNDPDMGPGYLFYNALDQLTSTRDNQGRTQHHKYDELGRQTELRDDSTTGPLVAKWSFDTLPGAKGHPVASTRYHDGAAFTSEITGYDTEYRPTGSKITIPTHPMTTGLAGTYSYATTYTPIGQPETVQLPATPGGLAAEKVITRYNGEGAPVTTSGLTWYTADTTYSALGQVLRTVSGEAPKRVWTTSLFDDNTGRLQQAVTDRETLNPSGISALTYDYDTVGNITSITDTQSSSRVDRQCFAYDPMGRLAHAWTGTDGCPRSSAAQGAGPNLAGVSPSIDGGGYWHTYQFDTIGNRTKLTDHDLTNPDLDDVHTYSYGTTLGGAQPGTITQPHTLTQVDSLRRTATTSVKSQSTYGYDSFGNTTQRVIDGDTQTLAWDRRNKVTSVDTDNNGTPNVKYLYDAAGNRILEDDGTTRTLFLGEAEITVNTSGQAVDAQRYYSHPGAPTTVRATGGKTTGHKLTVLQSDHHNTATNAIEQTAGQAITRRKFDPYGNPRGTKPTSWPSRHSYLGVGIDDPQTGLTHIGAREYDPTTGRFVSADPLIDLTDPLQMNGYTYANGNPITHSDPTGLIIAECGLQHLSCSGGNKVTGVGSNDPGSGSNGNGGTTVQVSNGNGGTVTVQKHKDSVTVNGTWVPNHDDLVSMYPRWASKKHSYDHDLKLWTRMECSIGAKPENAAFCSAASNWGWMGNTSPEFDLLEIIGVRDAVDCLGGSADACKSVATDAIITAATAGAGKAAKVTFKAIKAGAKEGGDHFPVSCLTKALKDSFPAGTHVQMADGSTKAIEDVQVGDKVVATDPETGETATQTVTATIFTKDDKNYVDLTITGHDGQTSKITATEHHPFWSESEQTWLDAGDLKPGTTLRTNDDTPVTVRTAHPYSAVQDTYNLTVASLHTYYVLAGDTPVLVHNSNGPPCNNKVNGWPKQEGGNCKACAEKIQEMIGGEKQEITTRYPVMGPSIHNPAGNWTHHWVVKKDGRIYDGTTGPEGMDPEDFKKQWEYHEDIDFGF